LAKITQILGATNYGTYCIVEVLLDNGEEGEVYVGGGVENYFDPKYGKNKCFVKKKKD
jgi:hypothetical protein